MRDVKKWLVVVYSGTTDGTQFEEEREFFDEKPTQETLQAMARKNLRWLEAEGEDFAIFGLRGLECTASLFAADDLGEDGEPITDPIDCWEEDAPIEEAYADFVEEAKAAIERAVYLRETGAYLTEWWPMRPDSMYGGFSGEYVTLEVDGGHGPFVDVYDGPANDEGRDDGNNRFLATEYIRFDGAEYSIDKDALKKDAERAVDEAIREWR